MVAAHDAGALEDALSRGLAAIGATTALLNWASSNHNALSRQRTPNIMKLAAVGKRSMRNTALTAALCGTLLQLRSQMAAALFNWEKEMISERFDPIWMLNDMGLERLKQWQQRRHREHTTTANAFGPQLPTSSDPFCEGTGLFYRQTKQTGLQPVQAAMGQQRDGQKQQPRAEQLTQPAVTIRMPMMKQQQHPVEGQRQSQQQPQHQPQCYSNNN